MSSKLWPPFLVLFSISLLSVFQFGCAQVDSPKPSAVQYGGVCSADYSKDYQSILNWPADQDIKEACDAFYAKYPGVKCFSTVDGAELRIHTNDFDNKCQKNGAPKPKPPKTAVPIEAETSRTQGLCSNELTSFIMEKYKSFQSTLESVETNKIRDEDLFSSALANKKICNQYFFNYKYTECTKNNVIYSFHLLKPYCDQFQMQLHTLRVKNPKKFSPVELKPLTGVNLKFHFEDSLLQFTSSKVKNKDLYLTEGSFSTFGNITSSQNYCYLESDQIRFAGELKNEVYKVDIAFLTRAKVVFSYNSFNEQWKMVCHVKDHFYLQDLLETLGDKVSVFE